MNTRTKAQQESDRQQFQTIVNTLLSPQPTEPEIIRHHVKEYAQNIGVPYDLARQAVIWQAQHILNQHAATLF